MPYVMVPVPEQHVEEVMQFVLRAMTRASLQPWDEESLGALFSEVDELSRTLLAFVARSALAGEDLPETEAARMMQLSGRETLAIQRELNEVARQSDREPLMTQRMVPQLLPNGRTTEVRVYEMEEPIARLVVDAERRELLEANDRLPGRA